jgi:hypothetical protein
MIVFNTAAFIQALILAIILLIFNLFGLLDFSRSESKIVQFFWLYMLYFYLFLSKKVGLNGTLFWIPTWFLCLVFIFLSNFTYFNFYDDSKNFSFKFITVINYILPIYFLYRMIIYDDFKKAFELSSIILNQLPINPQENLKNYWANVSHAIVEPSFLFKYYYFGYRFLKKNPVQEKELLEHYIKLLNKIKDKVTIDNDKEYLEKTLVNLMTSRNNLDLLHDYDFVKRVLEIVNREYKINENN